MVTTTAERHFNAIADGRVTKSNVIGIRKLLRSPRYRKRWNERQRGIIERLDHFKLVRFDLVGGHAIPVYRAVATTGQSFLFRNVPWQTAYYSGEQSGPIDTGENR